MEWVRCGVERPTVRSTDTDVCSHQCESMMEKLVAVAERRAVEYVPRVLCAHCWWWCCWNVWMGQRRQSWSSLALSLSLSASLASECGKCVRISVYFFAFSFAFFDACVRVYVLHGVHTITNATIIHISLCTTHRHIRFDCVFFHRFFAILFFLFWLPIGERILTHTGTDRERACGPTHSHGHV